MTDDLSEYERPILAANNIDGSLATDDSGFVRIINPLTGGGLFTSNMNPLVSGIDPRTGLDALTGTDVLFAAPVRRYLSSMVVNGAFEEPPDDTDSPIGEDNPLPGWRWVNESGSAFVPRWVAVGAGALNGQINCTMVSGAAGDRSYFEQLVPVNPSQGYIWSYRALPYITGDASKMDAYVHVQFIDATGAAVGAAATSSGLTGVVSPLYPDTDGSSPGTAGWLRFRIGWQRNSGAATTDVSVGAGVLVEAAVNGGSHVWGPVTFPATQVASTDVNVLDDYEEGDWTPVLTFATPGDLSVVYSVQLGRYIKVGKMVTCWAQVTTTTFTHTTASGALRVSGLPFTSATITNFAWFGSANPRYTKANFTQVQPQIASASTFMAFIAIGSGQVVAALTTADCPTTQNHTLTINISYEAAS